MSGSSEHTLSVCRYRSASYASPWVHGNIEWRERLPDTGGRPRVYHQNVVTEGGGDNPRLLWDVRKPAGAESELNRQNNRVSGRCDTTSRDDFRTHQPAGKRQLAEKRLQQSGLASTDVCQSRNEYR